MRAGDVLVGDRAFGSFAHLARFARQGRHGLFRRNSRRVVDSTPGRWDRKGLWGTARSRWVRAFDPNDQVVDGHEPHVRPKWLTRDEYAALPKRLRVRKARYTVDRPGFRVRGVTLVTTLLDAEAYPLGALADLYRQRWHVELDLRHLEATLGMDVLRCRTEAGVLKEMTLFALVYNVVRVVRAEAGRRQGVPVERIRFVDPLRWRTSSPIGTPWPKLMVNPDRADRAQPRCQKWRGKNYPDMIQPRGVLRQRLLAQTPAS